MNTNDWWHEHHLQYSYATDTNTFHNVLLIWHFISLVKYQQTSTKRTHARVIIPATGAITQAHTNTSIVNCFACQTIWKDIHLSTRLRFMASTVSSLCAIVRNGLFVLGKWAIMNICMPAFGNGFCAICLLFSRIRITLAGCRIRRQTPHKNTPVFWNGCSAQLSVQRMMNDMPQVESNKQTNSTTGRKKWQEVCSYISKWRCESDWRLFKYITCSHIMPYMNEWWMHAFIVTTNQFRQQNMQYSFANFLFVVFLLDLSGSFDSSYMRWHSETTNILRNGTYNFTEYPEGILQTKHVTFLPPSLRDFLTQTCTPNQQLHCATFHPIPIPSKVHKVH